MTEKIPHPTVPDLPPADLLDLALEFIEAHPKAWDQSTWVCGSTACLGGWAAMIDGMQVWEERGDYSEVYVARDPETEEGIYIEEWLDKRFGDNANDLFNGELTLEQLQAGVRAYRRNEDVFSAMYGEED